MVTHTRVMAPLASGFVSGIIRHTLLVSRTILSYYVNADKPTDTVENIKARYGWRAHKTGFSEDDVKVESDPFVMASPNENNKGGGWYCVTGTCREKGDLWWDRDGREGPP